MENKTESIAAEQNPASRKKVIMQAIKFVLFSARQVERALATGKSGKMTKMEMDDD